MATTLDLDEYLGEYMAVSKGGEVIYALRLDVPARVMLAAFSILSVADRLKAAPEGLPRDEQIAFAEAAVDNYISDVHKVCLRIVQHTYPNETSAELNGKLDEQAQERVVQAFFTPRSRGSSQLPDATDATSNGTEKTTTANREMRRAAAKQHQHHP